MATPSVADYEAMFAYATVSNPEIPPEMKDKGQNFLIQMENSPDVINFCLSQFNAFHEVSSFSVTFKCIEYRLTYCFEETPPEAWLEVRNLIFGSAVAKVTPLSNDVQDDLARVQAAFVMKVYPQLIGDIFTTALQMNDLPLLRFLRAFCKKMIIPRPNEVQQFYLIKQSITEHQIVPIILDKFKSGIIAKNLIAFTGFAHLIKWLPDLSWTGDNELMTGIMEGLSQLDTALGVFQVFASLTTRAMPLEQKADMCLKLGILQHLMNASEAPPTAKDFLMNAADVIELLGIEMMSTPLIKDIHEVAVRFYMYPDRDVSDCVSAYMYMFAIQNPELMPNIFQMVLQRTQAEFERDPLNAVGFFLMNNMRILSGLAMVNKLSALIEMIEQEAASVNIESNPAHASAVLFFVSECLKAKYGFPNFPAIFQKFMVVFSVQPPIQDNAWYVVFGFLRLIVFLTPDDSRFKNINQFTKEFLESITRFALSSEVSPVMKSKFMTLLLMYSRFWHSKTVVTKEMVLEYLNDGCKEIFGVAGALINGVGLRVRGEILTAVMNGFGSLLASPTKDNIILAFSCLLEIREIPQASVPLVGQFLQGITPLCVADDELLGMLLKSTVLVKPDGFGMFMELVNRVSACVSLEKAAETGRLWLKWAKSASDTPAAQQILSPDWAVGFAQLVFRGLTQIYQTAPLLTDQQKASHAILQCHLVFCEVLPLLPDELLAEIVNFAKTLIMRSYMSVFILESVLPFVSALAGCKPAIAAEQFTELTMVFLFNPDFNPLKNRSRLIDLIVQFHAKMSKQRSAYMTFAQMLSKVFSTFGADEDFVSRYFKVLEGDYRVASFQCNLLLMELVTKRNGLPELVFTTQTEAT